MDDTFFCFSLFLFQQFHLSETSVRYRRRKSLTGIYTFNICLGISLGKLGMQWQYQYCVHETFGPFGNSSLAKRYQRNYTMVVASSFGIGNYGLDILPCFSISMLYIWHVKERNGFIEKVGYKSVPSSLSFHVIYSHYKC